MFNYLGSIVKPTSEKDIKSSDYGLQLYEVLVPVIDSQHPIIAAVLTLPGVAITYSASETVILGELEQASDGCVRYFIFGRLQRSGEETLSSLPTSLARLQVTNASISEGNLNGSLVINSSGTNVISAFSANTTLGAVAQKMSYLDSTLPKI